MVCVKVVGVCFLLVSCTVYFSTLKMEVVFSSETSLDFHHTTLRYIPEDEVSN
jgi:hypothetical protein